MCEPIRVYALHCGFLCDAALFEKYYCLQPVWRRQSIDALKQAADKRLSLGAGILLRSALPGADLDAVVTGENGKPYLRDAAAAFNLSHAGDFALCAVGTGELGCDIERVRPLKGNIAGRFFHPREAAFIEAAPDDAEKAFPQGHRQGTFAAARQLLRGVGRNRPVP